MFSPLCSGDFGGQDGTSTRWRSDGEENPSASEHVPLLHEPLERLFLSLLPAFAPVLAPPARPCLPHRSPQAAARLFFQPGWRRQFFSSLKFQGFYSPPSLYLFLGFKTERTVFLWRRAVQSLQQNPCPGSHGNCYGIITRAEKVPPRSPSLSFVCSNLLLPNFGALPSWAGALGTSLVPRAGNAGGPTPFLGCRMRLQGKVPPGPSGVATLGRV